jgi:hypothetical protein
LDLSAGVSLDAFNGRCVGTALLDNDLLWQVMQVDGPRQEAPGSRQIAQQEAMNKPFRKSSMAQIVVYAYCDTTFGPA